jgi:hypothetical protein
MSNRADVSLRLGRCGFLLGAITAIALLPDWAGKVAPPADEGTRGESTAPLMRA